eukprot:763561-Hanusia_phi.AAC.1
MFQRSMLLVENRTPLLSVSPLQARRGQISLLDRRGQELPDVERFRVVSFNLQAEGHLLQHRCQVCNEDLALCQSGDVEVDEDSDHEQRDTDGIHQGEDKRYDKLLPSLLHRTCDSKVGHEIVGTLTEIDTTESLQHHRRHERVYGEQEEQKPEHDLLCQQLAQPMQLLSWDEGDEGREQEKGDDGKGDEADDVQLVEVAQRSAEAVCSWEREEVQGKEAEAGDEGSDAVRPGDVEILDESQGDLIEADDDLDSRCDDALDIHRIPESEEPESQDKAADDSKKGSNRLTLRALHALQADPHPALPILVDSLVALSALVTLQARGGHTAVDPESHWLPLLPSPRRRPLSDVVAPPCPHVVASPAAHASWAGLTPRRLVGKLPRQRVGAVGAGGAVVPHSSTLLTHRVVSSWAAVQAVDAFLQPPLADGEGHVGSSPLAHAADRAGDAAWTPEEGIDRVASCAAELTASDGWEGGRD